jgi:toxin HigB-1
MIRSFACPETERIFADALSRRLPTQIQRVARRKLLLLHQARRTEDLRVPPGNHLEALKGDRDGQHSIRINDHGGFASVGKARTRTTSKLSITTDHENEQAGPDPSGGDSP